MSYRNYSPSNGFIVDKFGNGDFTTIQAAVTAAEAIVVGRPTLRVSIVINPGIYTENVLISVVSQIYMTGLISCGNAQEPVVLNGKLSFSGITSSFTCENIYFAQNADFCIDIGGTNQIFYNFINCYFGIVSQINTPINYSSLSAVSILKFENCGGLVSTIIPLFTQSSPGTLEFQNCNFINEFNIVTPCTVSAGTVKIYGGSKFNYPITTSGTGAVIIDDSVLDSSGANATALTIGGSGTSNIDHSSISSGTASTVSVSSSATITSTTLKSSNTNNLSGSGTLTLGDISFVGSVGIQNTLTANGITGYLPGAFGSAGQVLTSNGALVPPTFQSSAAFALSAAYGDGSDGSHTFDGSTVILGITPSVNKYTLTRDIALGSSTINNGVSIITNGFRIFCNGTLTNNGTIQWNGNAGVAGGLGGTGGTVIGNVSGTVSVTTVGSAGGAGNTGAGSNGTNIAANFAGLGGAGGAGASGGGAAGTGGAFNFLGPRFYPNIVNGTYQSNSSPTLIATFCASGGGGGGGDGVRRGGGGGSGAGIVVLALLFIAGTGTISANGGPGGAADPLATNAGGGGGGGGGIILLISRSVVSGLVAGQTLSVAGGTFGALAGAGSNGSPGNTGTIVALYF